MIVAPAKVNLSLHITGKRADGYHLLDSMVVFTEFGDQLEITESETFSLTCSGDYGDLIASNNDNLVMKAARGMQQLDGKKSGLKVQLRKLIPVSAGLGGGSADAAAVIRFLCAQWNIDIDSSYVKELALSLGADVPVCLSHNPQQMAGIGEMITHLPIMPSLNLLLVNPKVALATADVFTAYQHQNRPTPQAWNGKEDLISYLRSCRNDLQPAAMSICPVVQEVLSVLSSLPQCLLARMSGSGASCYGVFASEDAMHLASKQLAKEKPGWWQAPTRVLS